MTCAFIAHPLKSGQTTAGAAAMPLPDQVSVAMEDLASTLREGLLALAVGAGFQVLTAVLDEQVTGLCGPKHRQDPTRRATRHGHEDGSVVLGGRKVPIRRPRVRATDGSGEVAIPAYAHFSSTEVLSEMTLERMLAKLSTRRYASGLEPVGEVVGPPRGRCSMPGTAFAFSRCGLGSLLLSNR